MAAHKSRLQKVNKKFKRDELSFEDIIWAKFEIYINFYVTLIMLHSKVIRQVTETTK